MIISSAKGTITLYNYAPLEDQLSKYFKNLKALKKKDQKVVNIWLFVEVEVKGQSESRGAILQVDKVHL